MKDWFEIEGEEDLLTPALLFYAERVEQNLNKMLELAGAVDRLRPHIKTIKCRDLVSRQRALGIQKFKCATLSEAAMLLDMGVSDVLLAYPLVGPEQSVFLQLCRQYPGKLSVLIDHPDQIQNWKQNPEVPIHCFIDLNVGMNRTGVLPEKADKMLALLDENLSFRGWHCYDGHIHDLDPVQRQKAVEGSFKPVQDLLDRLGPTYRGELICGGSITFPIHARHRERTLSPGTTVLWDHGYGSQFKDLEFRLAACLATRVVSQPGKDLLCVNLGHKAVAAEMTQPSAYFPQLPAAKIESQSEEHLVLRTELADRFPIGTLLYAFPWHICPTVALHASAHLIKGRLISTQVPIEARSRIYL